LSGLVTQRLDSVHGQADFSELDKRIRTSVSEHVKQRLDSTSERVDFAELDEKIKTRVSEHFKQWLDSLLVSDKEKLSRLPSVASASGSSTVQPAQRAQPTATSGESQTHRTSSASVPRNSTLESRKSDNGWSTRKLDQYMNQMNRRLSLSERPKEDQSPKENQSLFTDPYSISLREVAVKRAAREARERAARAAETDRSEEQENRDVEAKQADDEARDKEQKDKTKAIPMRRTITWRDTAAEMKAQLSHAMEAVRDKKRKTQEEKEAQLERFKVAKNSETPFKFKLSASTKEYADRIYNARRANVTKWTHASIPTKAESVQRGGFGPPIVRPPHLLEIPNWEVPPAVRHP
jgi:hypothetical protein